MGAPSMERRDRAEAGSAPLLLRFHPPALRGITSSAVGVDSARPHENKRGECNARISENIRAAEGIAM